jgi:hypothetical protein
VRPPRLEGVSVEDLAALRRLGADLRGVLSRAHRLAIRLHPARRRSLRALVRDRLLCVLQDSIAPAVRDLDSIASTAETKERG